MIIDFHTHTYPRKVVEHVIDTLTSRSVIDITLASDGTLFGLKEAMERDGIDLSVVLPVASRPDQVDSINELNVKSLKDSAETKVTFFAAIHPHTENVPEVLKRIKNSGFKGIKLHPYNQGVQADDISYIRLLYEAESLGLFTVIHAGRDLSFPGKYVSTPPQLKKLVDEVHPEHFILAHMGGCYDWDNVFEYLYDDKLYFDTAFALKYLPKDAFMEMVKIHGIDHILLGSDSPWCDMVTNIEYINSLPLSDEDKAKIFYKNGAKILGLDVE